jgi:hypothetical protein
LWAGVADCGKHGTFDTSGDEILRVTAPHTTQPHNPKAYITHGGSFHNIVSRS